MTHTEINMNDLIGPHILRGVSFGSVKPEGYYKDTSDTISFILDDKIYTAVEDDNDGYRSALGDIYIADETPSFAAGGGVIFAGVHVTAAWSKNTGEHDNRGDAILDFTDTVSGKIVLSVGTDYSDDWYPSFVASWMPENLSLNHE